MNTHAYNMVPSNAFSMKEHRLIFVGEGGSNTLPPHETTDTPAELLKRPEAMEAIKDINDVSDAASARVEKAEAVSSQHSEVVRKTGLQIQDFAHKETGLDFHTLDAQPRQEEGKKEAGEVETEGKAAADIAESAAKAGVEGAKNEGETSTPNTAADIPTPESEMKKSPEITQKDIDAVKTFLEDPLLKQVQELAAELPDGDTLEQDLAKNFLAMHGYAFSGAAPELARKEDGTVETNVKRVEGFAIFAGFVGFAVTGLKIFVDKLKGNPELEKKLEGAVQRLQTGFNEIDTRLLDKPYIERTEKGGVKLSLHFKTDAAMNAFREKFLSKVEGKKGVIVPDLPNVVQFEGADTKVVEFALAVLKGMHEGDTVPTPGANGETPSDGAASSPDQPKESSAEKTELKKNPVETITLSIEDTMQVIQGRIERINAVIADTVKEKETGGATLLMKTFGRGVQKAREQALKEEQSSLRKLETALRMITELKTSDEKPDQKLATLRQVRGQLGLPDVPANLIADYDERQKAILAGAESGDMNPDYKAINAQLAELDATLAKVESALQVADKGTDYLPGLPGLVKIAGLVAQGRMTPEQAARDLVVGALVGKLGGSVLKKAGAEEFIEQWVQKNSAKHFSKKGMEKLVKATKSGTEDAIGGSFLKAEELAKGMMGENEGSESEKKAA